MNIMGITLADKILTAEVASQAMGAVAIPASWITAGVDIFTIDIWSAASWTLEGVSGNDDVLIPADRVVTIAIRINRAKTATTLPFRIANGSAVHMLAHAADHAYNDQQ